MCLQQKTLLTVRNNTTYISFFGHCITPQPILSFEYCHSGRVCVWTFGFQTVTLEQIEIWSPILLNHESFAGIVLEFDPIRFQ